MGKYAYALVSAKYLDENGNFNVPKGEVAEVINFGWLWSDAESDQFWKAFVSGTNGTCITEHNGEKCRVERFETCDGMVYYIPGNGEVHVVSGITRRDYVRTKAEKVKVYCTTDSFAEALEVYDGMDKSKFWMLDLLSYDAHFAVRSTRRKIYA